VFTTRYGLNPYLTQVRCVFKGLKQRGVGGWVLTGCVLLGFGPLAC